MIRKVTREELRNGQLSLPLVPLERAPARTTPSKPRQDRVVRLRADRWVNERNRFGGSRDPITRTYFASDVRLGRQELDALFEHDWISRKVVEIPAKDATREWITLTAEKAPDKAEQLRNELERLNVREQVEEAITLGRLYGGDLLLVGAFDGGEVSQPLEPERVRRMEFLANVDRFRAFPLSFYNDPLDPRFGDVETYLVQRLAFQNTQTITVHESRVIRFDGNYRPPVSRLRDIGWHAPVLQNFYEALRQFGVSVQSGASVLQDFIVKKMKISNLQDLVSTGEWETVYDRLALAAAQMAINNIAVYGEDEDFEKMGTPAQGLHELMGLFIEYVSAAAEIPKSRLFQNQAGALGGDQGKNDLRIHYDNISAFQENHLRPRLSRLIDVVGVPLGIAPGEVDFTFNPLWQLTETEEAEVRLKVAQADNLWVQMGAIEPEEVAVSRFSGDGINLTDLNVDVERRKRILKELHEVSRLEPEPGPEQAEGGEGGAPDEGSEQPSNGPTDGRDVQT